MRWCALLQLLSATALLGCRAPEGEGPPLQFGLALGDTAVGRQLFQSKGCYHCHAVKREGGQIGPELAELRIYRDPVWIARAMWNHIPQMTTAMEEWAIPMPEFHGKEIEDLLAHLLVAADSSEVSLGLEPANVRRGWEVFSTGGCTSCHSVEPYQGGRIGPDLGDLWETVETPLQIAGIMWNHAPIMLRHMRAGRIPFPYLSGQEMADLLSFLFVIQPEQRIPPAGRGDS